MIQTMTDSLHMAHCRSGKTWRRAIYTVLVLVVMSSCESTATLHQSNGPSGNQLAGAASPYLREAGHQPVHWQAWGEEAFRRAQLEDKPILLDIGAVWCHWCHVMDRESYNNKEIARLINRDFIAIKVDRDERPDIDRRYQEAIRALTGNGGWPLTAFLTPEGQVFFGGTYFPPETREEQTGLKALLPHVANVYKEQKTTVIAHAHDIATSLTQRGLAMNRKGHVSDTLVQNMLTRMRQQFDPVYGWFGTKIKFPAGSAMELALARHFIDRKSSFLSLAVQTLDAMAYGGIYDQIGGGFFRYSTDPQWRVPHFEKMNDVNAELLINYLHAYQATGNGFYREVAEGIMQYLNTVLSDQKHGGFYAHQDADMTQDDDGAYYTWTLEEVDAVLSQEEAAVIRRLYDIRPKGEMLETPQRNVLFVAATPEVIAQELDITPEQVLSYIETGNARLLQRRAMRNAPLVDQTIYVDRNGLLISAYLEAFQVVGDEQAKAFALKTLERLLRQTYQEGQGFYHAYFEGHTRISGLLNDQVQMARALLDAFEVTGEWRYVHVAKELMENVIEAFWDTQAGGFFDRWPQETALASLSRPVKDIDDHPTASPNGVAVRVLDRLAALTNHEPYRLKAQELLEVFAGAIEGNRYVVPSYALALHYHLNPSVQVVIIGKQDDHKRQALWHAALIAYRPGKIVAVYDPTDLKKETLPPAVAGAVNVFGDRKEARAYVCAGRTCAPPTSHPEEVAMLVKQYGVPNE